MRYSLFTPLCRHWHTCRYIIPRLQLHQSSHQRGVSYRCSDEIFLRSASLHIHCAGTCIRMGRLEIRWSKSRSAHLWRSTDRNRTRWLGVDAIPDVPRWAREFVCQYHTLNFRRCSSDSHSADHGIRSNRIQKLVPFLLNWDNPNPSRCRCRVILVGCLGD
jgi:hypothetical protein